MAFHRLKSAFAALLVGVLIAVSAAAQQVVPEQVIGQFYATLLGVMQQAGQLGYDGRYQRLAPVIAGSYNLPFMARITTGIYWAKASEEQRSRFVEAFTNVSVVTYATQFDGYGGEQFNLLGIEEESPTSVLVKTELVTSDGDKVAINYLMRDFDGAWKIADVYTKGSISELAVKTSDYAQVLKAGGIEALTTALNKKAASLAAEEKLAERGR